MLVLKLCLLDLEGVLEEALCCLVRKFFLFDERDLGNICREESSRYGKTAQEVHDTNDGIC